LNGGEQLVRIAGAHSIEARGQLDKLTVELMAQATSITAR